MLLFVFILLATAVNAAGYCSMTGCADVTKCTCPPFFFDCIVQNDKLGVCTMTESGTWIIVSLVIALAIMVLLLVVFLCCCCCCKYRGARVINHHYKDGPNTV